MTTSDIKTEISGWSNHVLTMLRDEEECSELFRQCCSLELDRRVLIGDYSEPSVETVTLTSKLLHAGGTKGCGFTSAQIRLLGTSPKTKGWLKSLIGETIPVDTYKKFLELNPKALRQQS